MMLSFIILMAQRVDAERVSEREKGNDYFQQGFRYRWEKGKLSAGDVRQLAL